MASRCFVRIAVSSECDFSAASTCLTAAATGRSTTARAKAASMQSSPLGVKCQTGTLSQFRSLKQFSERQRFKGYLKKKIGAQTDFSNRMFVHSIDNFVRGKNLCTSINFIDCLMTSVRSCCHVVIESQLCSFGYLYTERIPPKSMSFLQYKYTMTLTGKFVTGFKFYLSLNSVLKMDVLQNRYCCAALSTAVSVAHNFRRY